MIENNGPEDNGHPLQKAVGDLKEAEEHLERARAEEAVAEQEVAIAIKEVEEAEHERGTVMVHVIHVNEVEKTSFREKVTATLRQVWDESYSKLGIPRKPKDVFQTAGENPKSLMNHLDLTLEHAHDQHIIEDFCFGIASETGGA
jgi:hypothetical protein